MKNFNKIISFETAKLAKEKGYFPPIVKLQKIGVPLYKLGIGTYDANGEFAYRNYYKQTNPHYLAPEKQELQQWLIDNNILVLVDYCYECTDTSYFYKIYKFVDEHGKCEKFEIKGAKYVNGVEIIETVGYRDYKRSYSDYKSYDDALEAGLQEALKMIEVKEIKKDNITIRMVNTNNYIENNNGILNIN